MIKMIVVDLDGTILNDSKQVSDNTKKYLTELKDKGYVITIATGRIYASAIKATEGATFANYLITDAGSSAYDATSGKPIFKHTIDREIAEKLFDYYDDDFKSIDICDKNTIYGYSDDESTNPLVEITKNKEYILSKCKEISHITVSLKTNEAVFALYDKLLKDITEVDLMIMQDSMSDRKWLEILPKNCSKYSAISQLSKILNISNDEIISFGDGLNDIDMLENCGTGVALANALPEAKRIADAITTYDNNNDGVIRYLIDNLHNE